MSEKVLTVPTGYFNTVIGQPSSGFIYADPALYVHKLLDDYDQIKFLERDKADADENFKQVIPYAILTAVDEMSGLPYILRYTRSKKGGETRLHDKLSIGFGGHITEEDWEGDIDEEKLGEPHLPYFDPMMRELAEEIHFDADLEYTDWTAGIIYDASTPVGRVHVGIAHIVRIRNWQQLDLSKVSEEVLDPQWRPAAKLYPDMDRFENWSKIVLKAIMAGHITL